MHCVAQSKKNKPAISQFKVLMQSEDTVVVGWLVSQHDNNLFLLFLATVVYFPFFLKKKKRFMSLIVSATTKMLTFLVLFVTFLFGIL